MKFRCRACGQKLEVEDDTGETEVQCPACSERIPIPPSSDGANGVAGGGAVKRDVAGDRYTLDDARTLWADAVASDAPPQMSIKSGRVTASTTAAERLLLRSRRVSHVPDGKEAPSDSDYELAGELGRGGMGVVYTARQASLDRHTAVKMIRPEMAQDPDAVNRFLAEAMVLAELDHPNIPPIHDLGGKEDGTLFYTMKEVQGSSWDKVIVGNSEEDNLRILLAVCDAVAYAHDRGVIHRDLKPENVMLGDYGEVLVMDWGLAASVGSDKAERLTEASGRAGTPVYMAPEMARREFWRIGKASDIYLLGAVLYEIVTGKRPHGGDTIYAAIHAAMQNETQPTDKQGELLDIALKAMADEPEDRFASVKGFREAVREYQKHAESRRLTVAAERRLAATVSEDDPYRELTEAVGLYLQALDVWPGNTPATIGLRSVRERLIRAALDRGDLAIADFHLKAVGAEYERLHALLPSVDAPTELEQAVRTAIDKARRRERINRISRRGLVAACVLIVAVSVVARVVVRRSSHRAEAARGDAERENYHRTVSQAEKCVADRLYARAETLLWGTPVDLRGWEWGRLMLLCRQELLSMKGRVETQATGAAQNRRGPSEPGGANSVEFSPDSRLIASANGESGISSPRGSLRDYRVYDGMVRIWDAEKGEELWSHAVFASHVAFSSDGDQLSCYKLVHQVRPEKIDFWAERRVANLAGPDKVLLPHDRRPFAASLSSAKIDFVRGSAPDELLVWGYAPGDLAEDQPDRSKACIYNCRTGLKILTATHASRIQGAALTPDGSRVLTCADDGVLKVWDMTTGGELTSLQTHGGPVVSLVAAADGVRVAAGHENGMVGIWDLTAGVATLSIHGPAGAAPSLAFSPDGTRIATGGPEHTIRIWDAAREQHTQTVLDHSISVAFSPDSRLAAMTSRAGIMLVDTDGVGKERRMFIERDEAAIALKVKELGLTREESIAMSWRDVPMQVAFSHDGAQLAVAYVRGDVELWDVKTVRSVRTLEGDGDPAIQLVCSPHGHGVTALTTKGVALTWGAGSGGHMQRRSTEGVLAVGYGASGDLLLAMDRSEEAVVMNDRTKTEQKLAHARGLIQTRVFFSSDGRRVLGARSGRAVSVWDVTTGSLLVNVDNYAGDLHAAALSPHGDRAVTVAGETASLWDVSTGRELMKWPIHIGFVIQLAFSPDGRHLGASAQEGACVWSAVDPRAEPADLLAWQIDRYRRWLAQRR